MKATAVYQHSIKDLIEYTGHSWYPEGLQVMVARPEPAKPPIQHPFRSNAYWVILVTAGEIAVQLDGSEHIVKENNLMIIPPHVVRQSAGPGECCAVACVIFTPEFLMDAGIRQQHIDSFKFLAGDPCTLLELSAADATRFKGVITQLQEKNFYEGDNPFAAEIVRHFFNVFQFELAGLYHKYSNQPNIVYDRKKDLLWRFLALLPGHVKSERSLQFYADRLYVTPKYLTQTVKKLSGQTAGTYIDNLVIVEAKNLLRDPALTIAQVADQLDFSDQFFFSKFFKRYTGTTPSEYRKMN
ncbi:helix-turn-helix transcriptional regulator [Paraflavitalea sp. CAU 1676]|uniref:helix-turn-helix transcriptional regulator n=1 Tax=Paraflavitalea sp. CAU 1676 TaxID=3032598 RepID=UPI0023DBD5C2|nr:helix-turn-helix transcriptional regulator [Paraflavitalea sp. CAU 1676]MDF2193397.1 helix-turn-helix transcriptional regulator [Paraflavitalea sp. CAU 1676]